MAGTGRNFTGNDLPELTPPIPSIDLDWTLTGRLDHRGRFCSVGTEKLKAFESEMKYSNAFLVLVITTRHGHQSKFQQTMATRCGALRMRAMLVGTYGRRWQVYPVSVPAQDRSRYAQ